MKTHVVTTSPDETLSSALDLMDLYQVEGLPVVDDTGRLCGMLTEQDIVNRILNGVNLSVNDDALLTALRAQSGVGTHRVAEAMTRTVISIEETTGVFEAALLLLRSGNQRLPVTNAEGKVVGTFNRVDVCQALFEGIL